MVGGTKRPAPQSSAAPPAKRAAREGGRSSNTPTFTKLQQGQKSGSRQQSRPGHSGGRSGKQSQYEEESEEDDESSGGEDSNDDDDNDLVESDDDDDDDDGNDDGDDGDDDGDSEGGDLRADGEDANDDSVQGIADAAGGLEAASEGEAHLLVKGSGRGPSDLLPSRRKGSTRPLTNAEFLELKETEELFKSNLFKLQMQELLSQVSVDHERATAVASALHELNTALTSMPSIQISAEPQEWVLNKAVQIPASAGRVEFTLRAPSPAGVRVVGSFLLHTLAKPELNVDVAVDIPDECLRKTDIRNERYFAVRALYLEGVAAVLKNHSRLSDVSVEYFRDDAAKPMLTIRPGPDMSGKKAKATSFVIRVLPSLSTTSTKILAAKLEVNKSHLGSAGVGQAAASIPTPHYNMRVAEDLMFSAALTYVHGALSPPSHAPMRDALVLFKVWLRRRGMSSLRGCGSSFGGFLASLLVAHLTYSGSLKASMSPYQVFRRLVEVVAAAKWDSVGLLLCSPPSSSSSLSSSAAAGGGTTAASLTPFTSVFAVSIVDPSRRFNYGHRMTASSLCALVTEARQTFDYLNDSSRDGFEAVFTTDVTLWASHDVLACVAATSGPTSVDATVSPSRAATVSDLGQDRWWQRKTEAVLARGLGGRATLVRVVAQPPQQGDSSRVRPAHGPCARTLEVFSGTADKEKAKGKAKGKVKEKEKGRGYKDEGKASKKNKNRKNRKDDDDDDDDDDDNSDDDDDDGESDGGDDDGREKTEAEFVLCRRVAVASSAAAAAQAAVAEGPTRQAYWLCISLASSGARGLVDRCLSTEPAAEEDFCAFWGEKADQRRFADASVCYAVVWEDPRTVVTDIIQHLMNHHGLASPADLTFVGGDIEERLLGSPTASDSHRYAALREVYERVVRDVASLASLPLKIASIEPLSAALRYTDVTVPSPHPLAGGALPPSLPTSEGKKTKLRGKDKGDGTHGTKSADSLPPQYSRVVKPLCLCVRLENSGSWPDHVEAISYIKAAFYLEMSKGLKSEHGLESVPTSNYIDVAVSGFVFRLFLYHARETYLLSHSTHDDDKAAAVYLSSQLVERSLLSSFFNALALSYPTFAPTCRLVKRWTAAHGLSHYLGDEAVELLVAAALEGHRPYRRAEASWVAFMRVLEFIARTDFGTTAVSVDKALTRDDYNALHANFASLRESGTEPSLFIATPGTTKPSTFTSFVPKAILARTQSLALAAVSLMGTALSAFGEASVQRVAAGGSISDVVMEWHGVMASSPRDFDVVLHLEPSIALAATAAATAVAPGGGGGSVQGPDNRTVSPPRLADWLAAPLYKNLLGPQPSRELLVDFDPVRWLVGDLEKVVGDSGLLFYDRYAPLCVFVLWSPAKMLASTSVEGAAVANALPLKLGKDKGTASVRNIFEIMYRLQEAGRGLVSSVRLTR